MYYFVNVCFKALVVVSRLVGEEYIAAGAFSSGATVIVVGAVVVIVEE